MSESLDWNLKSVRQYLWKHRGKVAAISAAVVATGIVVGLVVSSRNERAKSDEEREREEQERIQNENLSNKRTMQQLLFSKRQFELSSKQILPTLRLKINEVVDVLHTIRQIKELRMQSGSEGRTSHASDVENTLWEEIKVMSFVLWLVSIYGTCVLVPLLRIQIVLVNKHINKSNAAPSSSSNRSNEDLGKDSFDPLMDRTYSHLLERGIQTLTDVVRAFVARQLSEWTVKDTVVTYDELVGFVSKTRQFLEVETRDLVSTLLIRKSSLSCHPYPHSVYLFNFVFNVVLMTAKDLMEPRLSDPDSLEVATPESSVIAQESQRLDAFFAEVRTDYVLLV